MKAVDQFEREQMKTDVPYFRPGDTVRVDIKVREGDRERLQAFEGVCIARKHGGLSETFKVRKVSYGIGVERTFLLHSPKIASIKVVRQGHVRRAKLYYLRNVIGKKARIRSRKRIVKTETAQPEAVAQGAVQAPQVEEAPAAVEETQDIEQPQAE